jgi:hypothetical protein
MLARVFAGVGCVLIAGVIIRGALLLMGYATTGPGDTVAFLFGAILITAGTGYALGWHGRAAYEHGLRRARLVSAPAAPAASVPPAAGRQDASLTAQSGRGEITQPIPRVAPPVSCRQWAPTDIADGRPVCMIRHCGHTPVGYFRTSPEGWLCPCVHRRRERPVWAQ